MNGKIWLLIAISQFAVIFTEKVSYKNHVLIKVNPRNSEDIEALDRIKSDKNLDFWSEPSALLNPVLIHVNPEFKENAISILNGLGLNYTIIQNDLDDLVRRSLDGPSVRTSGFDLEDFHTLSEIYDHLSDVAQKNPDKVKVISIGKSFEERDIKAIVIGNSPNKVMLECGIHAREWASQASCLWIVDQLLRSSLLEKYSFDIVPVANPDGYEYTWTTDRFWRKTRSRNSRDTCFGADANRNWDESWCKAGASKDPCAEDYCGKAPFSEPESAALRDHVIKINKNNNLKAYFSIHAFSQYWMYPYGSSYKESSNIKQLKRLSEIAVRTIAGTHQRLYQSGPISIVIYKSSGSSIDWVHDKANVKVAFAIELRDKGEYNFLMPKNEIKPASEELWNGLQAVLKDM